jgi:flagella basal body P-ring formation protein FlgA
MFRIRLATALIMLAGPAATAAASTLHTEGTLAGPVVRLADLFDDAGPDATRVLGPAPAPGSRIVVEAAQLAAIARQFGVDWRPASSADRLVLERAGRPLPREAILDPLRAALTGVGAPADADISIPGFTAPMIAADARPDAGVEQLDYDAATGRFTASMVLTGADVATQHFRLTGQVEEMVDVVTPAHRIAPGAVLRPEDLRISHVRAALARGDVVRAIADAAGRALRRAVFPGQPIAQADITWPSIVNKGGRVAIELQAPGLTIAAQGVALASGALGDRISVRNPVSHAIVEAEVVAPETVRVVPGAVPVDQLAAARVASR